METGLRNLCFFEDVKLQKLNSSCLPAIDSETFNAVLNRLKKKVSDPASNSQPVPSSSTASHRVAKTVSKKPISIVDLSDSSQPKVSGNSENSNDKLIIKAIQAIDIERIRVASLDVLPSYKHFAQEVYNGFNALVQGISGSKSTETQKETAKPLVETKKPSLRGVTNKPINIPEQDTTRENGTMTYVEGILPLYSKGYKQALDASKKAKVKEPSILLAALIKYAFPDHWIVGVTVRGLGGNKSLIKIWNYQNPLKTPLEGPYDERLGEKRLQAFITHILRKTGRKSYDNVVEKHLNGLIAKSLHYYRNKRHGKQEDSDDELESNVYNIDDESDEEPKKKKRKTSESESESKTDGPDDVFGDESYSFGLNSGAFTPEVDLKVGVPNFMDLFNQDDDPDEDLFNYVSGGDDDKDDDKDDGGDDDQDDEMKDANSDSNVTTNNTTTISTTATISDIVPPVFSDDSYLFNSNKPGSPVSKSKDPEESSTNLSDSGIGENNSSKIDEPSSVTPSKKRGRTLSSYFERDSSKKSKSSDAPVDKNQESQSQVSGDKNEKDNSLVSVESSQHIDKGSAKNMPETRSVPDSQPVGIGEESKNSSDVQSELSVEEIVVLQKLKSKGSSLTNLLKLFESE